MSKTITRNKWLPGVQVSLVVVTMMGPSTGRARAQDGDEVSVDPAGPVWLKVEDGQFLSHTFRVFVNRDISDEMKPRLKLRASHVILNKHYDEWIEYPYLILAPNQSVPQTLYDQPVTASGTIILFDMSKYPIEWTKPIKRVEPILIWNDPPDSAKVKRAIGLPISIATAVPTFLWTFAFVAAIVILLLGLTKRAHGHAFGFLHGSRGHLSLSRTQVAAWTVAIGSVVAGFGLIHLELPNIPESLIFLMGMSLATTGVTSLWAAPTKDAPRVSKPELSDLVQEKREDDKPGRPSIARVQMVFWTVLMLGLFMVKSVFDQALWEVPWEMVALMGISQTGYVAPCLARKQAGRQEDA